MSTQEEFVQPVAVRRWPTERPLFVLILLTSIVLWILFIVSIVGIVYAAMIGVFFFLSHVTFIAYLRGSAVRLGPEQMPELFERVQQLSRLVGLRKTPEAYVMQAGGALNALATKLFSTNFIVLYSDLLEACGDNTEARDMIIAHELGHLKAGHLRGLWFLLPALFVPFLGSAYSRAREFTSDRYGFAACGDRNAALIGMSILAAGGRHGPRVNLRSLVDQRNALNTTWMTIGRWIVSHPPIADRIAAVEPTLLGSPRSRVRGAAGAIVLVASVVAIAAVVAFSFSSTVLSAFRQAGAMGGATTETESAATPQLSSEEIAAATRQAWSDMRALGKVIEEYQSRTGEFPEDWGGVSAAWKLLRPGSEPPTDPFDGFPYEYYLVGDGYAIWSGGPSQDTEADDLVFQPEKTQ